MKLGTTCSFGKRPSWSEAAFKLKTRTWGRESRELKGAIRHFYDRQINGNKDNALSEGSECHMTRPLCFESPSLAPSFGRAITKSTECANVG